MAVGQINFPEMKPVNGVRLNAVPAGIRYKGRDDLALIELCEGSAVAGCFTQNLYKAAPVIVAQQHLAISPARYLIVNSGNANACTGDRGLEDAKQSCELVSAQTLVAAEQVLPFSTGVIGEYLNIDAIDTAMTKLVDGLAGANWELAARAMMTTDTFPKMVTKEITIDGETVRINGIAKGAGMIRPDMATMLSYIMTDARVTQEFVEKACLIATQKSFNRVTVDGDTSTNDSVILAATQRAGNQLIDSLESAEGKLFLDAIVEVFQQLAQLLVRDGEGATKFVTLDISGGKTSEDCLSLAYCVAHSPLVKTAMFASDPNWGRLVAAIGRSGIDGLDASKVKVWLNEILIVENGSVAESYTEEAGQAVFNQEEFCIKVDMQMGSYREQVWTCDLSHEYVSINADYRS